MTRWLLCNLFGVCVVLMSATQDLKCQALREILLVGLDSGSAADHLFRSARDELQPSVRVVPIDGDLSQYPWRCVILRSRQMMASRSGVAAAMVS
jgi:hypothetical protein